MAAVTERSQTTGVTHEPLVSVRDLWMVFGPKAGSVPSSPELCGLSRRELIDKTGNTIAVRDIEFDVAPEAGAGKLRWLFTPRVLRTLAVSD